MSVETDRRTGMDRWTAGTDKKTPRRIDERERKEIDAQRFCGLKTRQIMAVHGEKKEIDLRASFG